MKSLDHFFQNDIVHALGWTILHSIWQGLLIVVLLTIALVLLRKQSSRIRYLVGYAALFSLAICSLGTFFYHFPAMSSMEPSTEAVGGIVAINDLALALNETAIPSAAEETYWQSFIHFLEANLPWITVIWMLGVLILSLRFLAELAYVQRLKHQPGAQVDPVYQKLLDRLAASMGLHKMIQLKESLRIDGPMVIGFLKPVILVPVGLLARLDTAQVESILAHELAHVKRHDYIFNLLQSLVEILLFFNPATWWISALIRSEREHCCDEMAIAQTGNQLVFVQTLAQLEEYRRFPNNMALAFNGRRQAGVLGRIQRIVNSEESFRLPYKLFWSSLIFLSSLGLLAFQAPHLPLQEAETVIEQDSIDQSQGLSPQELSNASEDSLEEAASVQKEKAQQPVPAAQQKQQPVFSANITKENISNRAEAEERNVSQLDTVPKEVRELRQQMMKLSKDLQAQEMVFQKQVQELQKQKLQLEMEVQKQENNSRKDLYELKKKSQNAQMNQNLKMKELKLENSVLENQIVEAVKEREELEQQLMFAEEEEENVKLRKQRAEVIENIKKLEKKKRELELTQKREQLETEKELQNLLNQLWQQQEEAEIAQNEERLKLLEIEQKQKELQFKQLLIQQEMQQKMQQLEKQIQEKMMKREEK